MVSEWFLVESGLDGATDMISFREAIGYLLARVSDTDASLHTTVNNMASVYDNQDYNKTLEWYGRALAGLEKSLGKDHPDTLATVNNMASVYVNRGDCRKTFERFRRALAGMEKLLGKDHPSTLTAVNNTALVYSNQGGYNKALEWLGWEGKVALP